MYCVVASWSCGCGPLETEVTRDLQRKVNALKVENINLNDRLAVRDAEIERLRKRLAIVGDKRGFPLGPMFDVRKIEILDITSGSDLDGKPGDDGVTVYFRPVDRDGHVLKRGGEIKIKLLDNSPLTAPTVLGNFVLNAPDRVRHAWYGKFWTNHYKIQVPFHPEVAVYPGQEVDIHVSFTDWITGEEHTARKVVKIRRVNPD